jgi:ABC-type transport system involved in multi-copper enzyme maturation permease subunit
MRLFAEERSSGTLEMLLTAPIRDWQVVFAKYVACFGFYTILWLPTLVYLPILGDWSWSISKVDYDNTAAVAAYAGVAAFAGVGALICLFMAIVQLFQVRVFASLGSLLIALVFAALCAGIVWPIYMTQQWITIQCGIDFWPIATTYLGLALAGAMFLSIGLLVSSLVTSQMIAAIVSLAIGVVFIAGAFVPEMDSSSLLYQIMFYITVPLHFERNWSRGLIDTRQLVLYGSVTLFCLFLTVRSLESRRWR